MSDGIQRAAGQTLRGFLNKMTSSKLLALFTGFIITSLIQSSSASTVLTVGLVNAGLLTVGQSVGVIFGINIGTTVTGWIISVLGVQLSSYQTVLPLLILITPLLFAKKKIYNAWGDFLMGFILLLIGLFFMRDNVPDFSALSADLAFLEKLASYGILSTVLFVVIGFLITVVLQSSTATMALTLVLCTKGWLPFEVSTAMILGSNIGTTSTAEIAALIGSVAARRTARIHTFFNLYGSIWAILLMPFLLRISDWIGNSIFYDGTAFDDIDAVPYALAVFHSLFNILNVGIFLLFPRLLIYSAMKSVREKPKELEDDISTPLKDSTNLPELSILAAQNEVVKFAAITKKMNQFLSKMLSEVEEDARQNAYQIIRKNEEKIDRFQKVITNYLSDVMSVEMTSKTSHRISAMLSICNEFERIGDLYLDMAKLFNEKNQENIWFNTQQRSQTQSMLFILDKEHTVIIDAMSRKSNQILVKGELSTLHNELKELSLLAETDMEDNPDYHKKSPKVFNSIMQTADNISDHLYSIGRLLEY